VKFYNNRLAAAELPLAATKGRMKRIGLTVLVLACGGCVTLTPSGANVRVTRNPNAVAGCKYLGDVDEINFSFNGEDNLKNMAGKLGGNAVLETSSPTNVSKHDMGEVYLCEERKP
jgi:hypothetical protein